MSMPFSLQQRPDARHWISLLCILGLHAAVLWLAMHAVKKTPQQQVRFLSLINIQPTPKPPSEVVAPVVTQRIMKKPLAASNQLSLPELHIDANTAPWLKVVPTVPDHAPGSTLNLDELHKFAMKDEHLRPISGMEKLQASQKLNLSIEAKLDRALNEVILPECRQMLLGKPMLERMAIIQNHNNKKFCR